MGDILALVVRSAAWCESGRFCRSLQRYVVSSAYESRDQKLRGQNRPRDPVRRSAR